nr:hypothetical protein [Tanacetum cinerariifolium]
EASPPDSELVGLEKSPSPFPILDEDNGFFFEKFDTSLSYSDKSLPGFETFRDHTKETSSVSTTTHADNSLPEYDSFLFEIEPDQGELTSVVMEDILGGPHVHVPNVLPTHPTLMLDSDFIPSDDFIGSDLEVSFPSGTRNKIFDPGIFFEVQSKRFLSRDTFSISFIRNLLCPVIETLLPFLSENKEKFSVLNYPDFEDSRAHGFVHQVLNIKKSNHPFSGSIISFSDSTPSLTPFETSDSLLEEFADELALLDPFTPGNKDDNFDPEYDLREIKYLLNQYLSTVSSPTTDIINPILERFTDEPALVYSSPPGEDDDDDDDLFDLKFDNDEWKKLLYGDNFNDTYSEKEKKSRTLNFK